MAKKPKITDTDRMKENFEIKCKKCGSEAVFINYEREGGYSEYTQWGSSVSMFCQGCQQSTYLEGD